MIDARIKLYIPHGSDESREVAPPLHAPFCLYIPHGSDERMGAMDNKSACGVALYPTWFR